MATSAAYVDFTEAAAPATPATGKVRVYAKTDSLMYQKDDAGAETGLAGGGGSGVATDPIWDAAGDLAVGSGANTAARLAIGATNGMVLARVAGAVAWAFPPGHEFDYAEFTSDVSVTNTTEGTADTVIAGGSVAYDGSTVVYIEFFAPVGKPQSTAAASLTFLLYEDSTLLGWFGGRTTPAANNDRSPVLLRRKRTPSAASHTYTVKAMTTSGTATVSAGTGGTGAYLPGYIRVVKA